MLTRRAGRPAGALLLNRSIHCGEGLAVIGIDESILGSPDPEVAFRDRHHRADPVSLPLPA